jgi:hypothetical protein
VTVKPDASSAIDTVTLMGRKIRTVLFGFLLFILNIVIFFNLR